MMRARTILLVGLVTVKLEAQAAPVPTPAAIQTIREQDLRRDLFTMAGDATRGREAGTLDEMRASMWTAEQLRSIGLDPMGEDGTYFQWFNMRRTRVSTIGSTVRIGGKPFTMWSDISPASNTTGDVVGQTVFVGDGSDSTIDVRGRIAVVMLQPTSQGTRTTINTPEYRAVRQGITVQSAVLTRRGAAAVIVVADAVGERMFDAVARLQSRGGYTVIGGANRFAPTDGRGGGGGRGGRGGGVPAPQPGPILLAHASALEQLQQDGQGVEIHLRSESFDTPSVNIIGAVRGTDPVLRNEYIVFSSHQDHDGVRYAVDGDSIWNGADDNGSTSVALLAIARAWVKQPSRRSALFIYHGAEERGLLGSLWHAAHPVVPLTSMAAVLNGDMIGRNHPDTASLLGVQPPHRNSTTLVEMALDANRRTGKFVLDSLWDRPSHPEGWYFRSDHVPYARLNVPALFFTTTLHDDYHTPRDNPDRIDYAKLTRMTRWMYLTGWIVANAKERPAIDVGFQLER
jgi:hypothetical protein